MEEGRNAFKILTGTPTAKIPLGTLRRRWEDNVRMDIKEIGINTMDWVDSALDMDHWRALVNWTSKLPGFISHGVSSVVF